MKFDFSPRDGQPVADSEIVTNADCIFSPKKLVRRKTQTDKVLIRWDLLKAGANSPNSKKWGRRWGCTLFHTNHCRVKTAETIEFTDVLGTGPQGCCAKTDWWLITVLKCIHTSDARGAAFRSLNWFSVWWPHITHVQFLDFNPCEWCDSDVWKLSQATGQLISL